MLRSLHAFDFTLKVAETSRQWRHEIVWQPFATSPAQQGRNGEVKDIQYQANHPRYNADYQPKRKQDDRSQVDEALENAPLGRHVRQETEAAVEEAQTPAQSVVTAEREAHVRLQTTENLVQTPMARAAHDCRLYYLTNKKLLDYR